MSSGIQRGGEHGEEDGYHSDPRQDKSGAVAVHYHGMLVSIPKLEEGAKQRAREIIREA